MRMMSSVVNSNFTSAARHHRIVWTEVDIVNDTEITPKIKLIQLVLPLMNYIRGILVDVFQIKFVHSLSDLMAAGLSSD